jgi:CheY-like chemotaxis protein
VILLIEDDVISRHILTALLSRMRLPHRVARTREEAAEVMARHPVDLVIVDLRIADADGMAMVDELVAHGADPGSERTPVLYCSSFSDPAAIERVLATGAVELVRRPIDVGLLADAIDSGVRRAPVRA